MKVSARGQITIPKSLRKRYGLIPNAEVDVIPQQDGVSIRPANRSGHPVSRIRGIVKLRDAESVDDYIEAVRGR